MRHDLGGHVDQHETTTPTERKPLGRRTVLKGAAWSVPAVVAVGATPAFAATGNFFTFDKISPQYLGILPDPSLAVEVTGTVSSGTVSIVVNNGTTDVLTENATVSGTDWTYSITTSALPEGVYGVTASSAYGSDTKYFYKDLTRPNPTIYENVLTAPNGNAGSIVVTLGTATFPTSDLTTGVTLEFAVQGFTVTGPSYDSSTGRTTFTWTYAGTGNGKTKAFTVTQYDQAGNAGTATGTTPN